MRSKLNLLKAKSRKMTNHWKKRMSTLPNWIRNFHIINKSQHELSNQTTMLESWFYSVTKVATKFSSIASLQKLSIEVQQGLSNLEQKLDGVSEQQ